MKPLVKWLVCMGSLFVAWKLFPNHVFAADGLATLAAAGTVLWLVNLFVRPVVKLIALPVTILTLGIFSLVINAAMVGLTSALLPGFRVSGFWICLFISILISVGNCIFLPKHENG